MAILIIFVVGLAFGSFFNVVIWRVYSGKSIIKPRSFCPSCKTPIKRIDNIPLVSYLLLGGRCRNCKKHISWQYPLVELATALLFVWLHVAFGLTAIFFSLVIFTSFLIILFVYDARYYIIPDQISLPAIVVAFIINILLGVSWFNLLTGMVLGAGFFLFQFLVSGGRWIGGGDIRLGGLMGAMLGWQMILVALFISYMVGSVIGIAMVVSRRKQLSSKVPFGTFLTASTFITFIYGEKLLNWYLTWTV